MRKQYHNLSDPLSKKSFSLAVRMVNLYRFLTEKKREFVLSKQILRSGTNPGSMVREPKNAETGKDFIHKLGIAQKETGETMFWLELLQATDYINETEFNSLYDDTEEVMKLLTSSIKTST